MSREDPQMKLRMPEALRDLVVAASGANKRSINAEIVARLEASFQLENAAAAGAAPSNAELRRSIDARLDAMENGTREQQAIFASMIETAEKVLGEEFVAKARATVQKRR